MASFRNLLPWPGGDKKEGGGCGDFFRSLLDGAEKPAAPVCATSAWMMPDVRRAVAMRTEPGGSRKPNRAQNGRAKTVVGYRARFRFGLRQR
jgi:hypothetical protein